MNSKRPGSTLLCNKRRDAFGVVVVTGRRTDWKSRIRARTTIENLNPRRASKRYQLELQQLSNNGKALRFFSNQL
eukprot:scaffold13271_cov110-Cylindrotheca_fusiformis.AAC.4